MSTVSPIDLSAIDPKNGDKLSPNLHRFLRHRRSWSMIQRGTTYRSKDGALYFGFTDERDFLGAQLMSILVKGARAQTYCFINGKDFTPAPEVMAEYLRIGRCAFDPAHWHSFQNSEGRYVTKGNRRTCQWCGAIHRLIKKKRTVTDTFWKPVTAPASPKATP